ncbi:prepilin-type N-terminal cleavage/methylation domain-containing protein [Pseudoalteromonas sp. MM17-2]|uniref:PilW family protein n=1 Tax=Pseudoalteromonas sp. MM17-2 TaxID=2917753 RepID=UPI001EF48A24|nr:type II secretion system protein [Pseudoalteromonas sp. MM17-2]MCG7543262.1 prepilin-type N-terminal cleavage/methylation domain-containing protein [Pseudoalteromonas sp. MM17-2]
MKRAHLGFTLVELMVALAVGSFLIAGVGLSYATIKGTVSATKELENAQEVVRFTSQVLTRSLKQTPFSPVVSADGSTLRVQQQAGVLSCLGTTPSADYIEQYRLVDGRIQCDMGAGGEDILTGVTALSFSYDATTKLTTINVTPQGLPQQFGGQVQIDIAASRLILSELYGASS